MAATKDGNGSYQPIIHSMDPSATTSRSIIIWTVSPIVVGVTFQVHTQSWDVTLSTSLSLPHETTTNGTHVGLVQFRSSEQNQTEFYATFKRGLTNGTVRALIAAVPIYMNGKCSGSLWGRGGAVGGEGVELQLVQIPCFLLLYIAYVSTRPAVRASQSLHDY